jgi:hypothetical protein
VFVRLQESFAHQAVSGNILWKQSEDMAAMCLRFIGTPTIDQFFNSAQIIP